MDWLAGSGEERPRLAGVSEIPTVLLSQGLGCWMWRGAVRLRSSRMANFSRRPTLPGL